MKTSSSFPKRQRTKEIYVAVEKIKVPKKHREINSAKLPIIMNSMREIGLKTPITVRRGRKGLVLVVGRHRLEAAKRLRWDKILCVVGDGDKNERQLWAIAENLHRTGLSRIERADLTALWDKIFKRRTEGAQTAQPGGRQPHDKNNSKAAKELGKSRDEVRRDKIIAGLSKGAKKISKKIET